MKTLLFIITFLAIFYSTIFAAFGKVTDIKGSVAVIRNNEYENNVDYLSVGNVIQLGDKIITGINSFCEIQWRNGSSSRIEESTSITINRISISQTRIRKNEQINISLHVSFGELSSSVEKFEMGTETFEVSTPVAVAGIRGTDFKINHNPKEENTNISVNKGSLQVKNITTNEITELKEGFSLKVDRTNRNYRPEPLIQKPTDKIEIDRPLKDVPPPFIDRILRPALNSRFLR